MPVNSVRSLAGHSRPQPSVKAFGTRTMNTTTGLSTTQFSTTINGFNCQIVHRGLNAYWGSNLQFVYTNRCSDTAAPNSITLMASLEYPTGVFHRITFSGATSITLPVSFNNVFSDPVLGVTIPPGASYVEHTFVSFTAGQGAPYQHVRQLLAANGDGFSSSASETDKTMTSLTAGSNAWFYGAVAIVALTNAPFAIGLIGDSIISCGGDTQTGFFVGYPERAIAGRYGTVNTGQSSETCLQYLQSHAGRLPLIRACGITHAHVEYGTNDIAASATLGQVQTYVGEVNSMCAASGIQPYNNTIIPRTSSTDSWATAANQSFVSGFAVGGVADLYNTGILSSPLPFAAATFDVNAILQDPGNARKWLTNGTANYLTTDGTHPNAVGAPLAATAVNMNQIGPAGIVPSTVFPQAGFWLDARDITGVTNGSAISAWTDRAARIAGTPNTGTAPNFRSLNSPDGLCSSVRFTASTANQSMIFPGNAAYDNLASGSFYMLMAVRLNSNPGGMIFQKATSGHRLIYNTGNVLQLDLFYNTSNYSFSTISMAGAAGANNWVVIELTYNVASPTLLGVRSAAGFGGINVQTKTATGSPSGGAKTDTGASLYLGSANNGSTQIDGDIASFVISKTLPTTAEANRAFWYLRGLIGC